MLADSKACHVCKKQKPLRSLAPRDAYKSSTCVACTKTCEHDKCVACKELMPSYEALVCSTHGCWAVICEDCSFWCRACKRIFCHNPECFDVDNVDAEGHGLCANCSDGFETDE